MLVLGLGMGLGQELVLVLGLGLGLVLVLGLVLELGQELGLGLWLELRLGLGISKPCCSCLSSAPLLPLHPTMWQCLSPQPLRRSVELPSSKQHTRWCWDGGHFPWRPGVTCG